MGFWFDLRNIIAVFFVVVVLTESDISSGNKGLPSHDQVSLFALFSLPKLDVQSHRHSKVSHLFSSFLQLKKIIISAVCLCKKFLLGVNIYKVEDLLDLICLS